MRGKDTRFWAALIAAAFVVLWFFSVGITKEIPVQEPLTELTKPVSSPELQVIGILGWCIVGLGFLGVAVTVALESRPRRRRKTMRTPGAFRRPRKMTRSIYSPTPARRYHPNVERRY